MARTLSLPSKLKKSASNKAARPVVTKKVTKAPAKTSKPANKAPAKKQVVKKAKAPLAKKPAPIPRIPAKAAKAVAKPAVVDSKTSTDWSKDPINARLKPAEKIEFLREMLRIRRFEQQALKHYNNGAMGGFLHLYIGQ